MLWAMLIPSPTHNLTAADELADVRDRIRTLKSREAALRAALLSGDVPRIGTCYRVEITTQSRRRLDTARLPVSITSNPRYWQHSQAQIVRVVELVVPTVR